MNEKRFTVTVLPYTGDNRNGFIAKGEDSLTGKAFQVVDSTERLAMTPLAAWIDSQVADKTTQNVDTSEELALP